MGGYCGNQGEHTWFPCLYGRAVQPTTISGGSDLPLCAGSSAHTTLSLIGRGRFHNPSPSPAKSPHPLPPLPPDGENTLGNPCASPRRQVSGFVEVVCNLTVRPSTGPQRENAVDQLLLVGTQRSNVECHRTAANDESLRGLSAGTLRSRSLQTYSTVTK